jgi:hypothetical protein
VTAPQPTVPMLNASTEVRQDPQGNVIVVLRLACGPAAGEFFVSPADAERFGEGIAKALTTAGEQAKALVPGLMVPPKGFIVPRMNGQRT